MAQSLQAQTSLRTSDFGRSSLVRSLLQIGQLGRFKGYHPLDLMDGTPGVSVRRLVRAFLTWSGLPLPLFQYYRHGECPHWAVTRFRH